MSQLGICCLFQIHQKWVSAVWASCKAWLCLICLQYSIHKATLLLWQALITTSGQIFSPNHPPSLLMLWCIWTPWSDQFFSIYLNVFFKGEKLNICHWLVFMILQHPGIDFSKANLKQRSMTKSFFVLTCRLGLSTTKKVSGTPNDSPK